MVGLRTRSGIKEVVAVAASATLTNDDVGKIITNRGASGSVTYTLPAPSQDNAGGSIEFMVVANQTILVNCETNDLIVIGNDAAADSVSYATGNEKIGASFIMTSDGTNWFFRNTSAAAFTLTTAS